MGQGIGFPSFSAETAGSTVFNPKVLYIIGQLDRGGAEQQLYYLLKYLRPRATILSLSQNGYWVDPIRRLGFHVIELNRKSRFDVTRIWATYKVIKGLRPDIVHLFLDSVSAVYGRVAALMSCHPCVIVGNRLHSSFEPTWYSLVKRLWFDRHISIIVTNAHASEEYLVMHDIVPPDKVKFVPNGIELDRFVATTTSNRKSLLPESWRDKVIVGTVGRLHLQKAPHMYVRVAKRVLADFPEVRFVHVGEGPLREEIEGLSRQLGIDESIHFLGLRSDIP